MAIRVPISVVILLSAIILFSVYIESCTPPTAEELENDGWSKFNNRWYRIFPKICDADEAEQSCEVFGAHLISIHSKAEDNFVTELFNKYNSSPQDALWIGLRRIKRNSTLWKYIDGTKVDYFNWYQTQPENADYNEECAQIYTPAFNPNNPRQWGDHKCHEHFRVGCKL